MTIRPIFKAARNWAQITTVASCIFSLVTLQWMFRPAYLDLSGPVRLASMNVRSLLQPREYRRQMEQELRNQQASASLPRLRKLIGNGTVDVFGNYQCAAFWNGLNYSPRPVFQSYAAYSEPLMKLNEDFYRSTRAPAFVLAKLWSIDSRFPPLEDALVFRHLLTNYELVANQREFLLLKQRSSNPARLDLLCEGTVLPGERIDFARFGATNIWLQLFVQETLAGKVTELVYQPPAPRLRVWADGPEKKPANFHAPAPMMKAGFVASPLIATLDQLEGFYKGKPVVRPAAYSVELGEKAGALWSLRIRYRAYRMEIAPN